MQRRPCRRCPRSPATRTSRSRRRCRGCSRSTRPRRTTRRQSRGTRSTDDPHVTAVRRLPAVAAQYAPFPEALDARLRRALRARGIEQLYTHQAEADRARARRPQRRHRHADGVGQDALLQRAGAATRSCDDPSSRALYLFPTKALAQDQLAELHQMAEIVGAEGGGEIGVFTYDGDTPQDARRAIRGARARRAQQSRHGALGHPAAPSALGEALREPEVRRHRRAARLSRRVRQPPGEHHAAAAARLPALRIGSDVHLLVGDDRESARAGRAADRRAVRARRAERRAARREVLSVRQSAGRQRAARHPALVSRRDAPRRDRVPEARPAADRLRAEPAVDGDPHDVPEGRVSGPAGRGRRDSRLSRRLSAAAPARDRARAAQRRRALRGLDQRARARHRHRRARRRGDGGLSGHDRRDLAARGPRGPPIGPIGGGARRVERADRSVRRPQSRVLLRRVARARARQSGQPAHPARPREVRGVRAAVPRRRRVRHDRTCRRSWRCSPRRASCTSSTASGSGRRSRIRPTR